MAFFPCSNHHAPYRGPSCAAYPAIVDGPSSNRRHLRMCEPCFGDYLETVAERLTEVDFGSSTVTDLGAERRLCKWCGARRDDRQVFVTAYPKGEPERAFFGGVCVDCEPKAVAEILLS
jgi:hypothetical protein